MLQKMMNGDMYDSNYPTTYSNNNNNREFMEMFAKMFGDNMYNKMDNYRSNSDSSMSRFFDMFKRNRVQRAASEDGAVSPSLDLGDRLVEKLSQRHPLINSQSSVIPGIILLEQSLVLSLCRNREIVLLWNSEELIHHSWKLRHLDDSVLVRVVVSEDLQHVPVQLNMFWTSWRSHGSFDELLVVIHTSMVNDGMRIHGGSLGSDVLLAELQPFIKGDDASGLEIHGVEHLLSGGVLLCLSLVQSGILRSVSISSGHRCGGINQLRE